MRLGARRVERSKAVDRTSLSRCYRELPLLDPELGRELWLVAAHLLDEPLRVLATDEGRQHVAQWEAWRRWTQLGLFLGMSPLPLTFALATKREAEASLFRA